jgi:hypothetical protein
MKNTLHIILLVLFKSNLTDFTYKFKIFLNIRARIHIYTPNYNKNYIVMRNKHNILTNGNNILISVHFPCLYLFILNGSGMIFFRKNTWITQVMIKYTYLKPQFNFPRITSVPHGFRVAPVQNPL